MPPGEDQYPLIMQHQMYQAAVRAGYTGTIKEFWNWLITNATMILHNALLNIDGGNPATPYYGHLGAAVGTNNYIQKVIDKTTNTIGDSLIYDNGTNVGIGTTSPVALLTIQTTGDTPGDMLRINNRSNTYDRISWGWETNGYNSYMRFGNSGGFTHHIQNISGQDIMTMVSNTGVVTIGGLAGSSFKIAKSSTVTTYDYDSAYLKIGGGRRITGNLKLISFGTAGPEGGVYKYAYPGGYIGLIDDYVTNAYGAGCLVFGTKGAGDNTTITQERMRVDVNGNVGINTTAPTSKLSIKGQGVSSSTSALNVTNSADTSMLYVRDDGNVGIGTIAPEAKLDVNGAVKVGNDSAVASASNAGAIRYRADANNSYCEMVMQTGASTYAWVIIKQNTW